jgi:nitroreductase
MPPAMQVTNTTMHAIQTRPHVHTGVDVIDAIYDRRAVRSFKHRQVGADSISRLLDAAVQAPSAMNNQPWAFAIVQDLELQKRISDRSKQLVLAAMLPDSPLAELRAELEDPAFHVFYDATTVIVVCARLGDPGHLEDCSLAAQNLMLAAHGIGLATCPIGLAREAMNEPEFRRELGIPDDFTVVLPIALGYPRGRTEAPPRHEPRILGWK